MLLEQTNCPPFTQLNRMNMDYPAFHQHPASKLQAPGSIKKCAVLGPVKDRRKQKESVRLGSSEKSRWENFHARTNSKKLLHSLLACSLLASASSNAVAMPHIKRISRIEQMRKQRRAKQAHVLRQHRRGHGIALARVVLVQVLVQICPVPDG